VGDQKRFGPVGAGLELPESDALRLLDDWADLID
jgi:hypothetical protein